LTGSISPDLDLDSIGRDLLENVAGKDACQAFTQAFVCTSEVGPAKRVVFGAQMHEEGEID